jgi:hypothetical protein
MKYENIQSYKNELFRRVTGVKRETFNKMVAILQEAENKKKISGGRPNKLTMENRLLMALEFLRENRTYCHVASSYGISESVCFRNIRWIENTLIKHPDFALPGKKALLESNREYELVLIDATETPIERPKKKANKNTFIQEKRNGTQ